MRDMTNSSGREERVRERVEGTVRDREQATERRVRVGVGVRRNFL